MDRLVSDDAKGALAQDDDEKREPERHSRDENRDGVGAEEVVDAIPADRAEPVEQARDDDRLPKWQASGRKLSKPQPRAHRAEQRHEERADDIADDDRKQPGHEAELQEIERD